MARIRNISPRATSAVHRLLPAVLLVAFLAFRGEAATVTGTLTNSVGVADTNYFVLYNISGPIAANGTFITVGVPRRITPNSSGFFTTNLLQGNYLLSNSVIVNRWNWELGSSRGLIIAVPSGSGTFDITDIAHSGANVFNYNGSQFSVTASNIFFAMGFTPLTPTETTNAVLARASTNTLAPGSNMTFTTNGAVITVASSGGGGGTNTVSTANTFLSIATNAPNFLLTALNQTQGMTSLVFSNPLAMATGNQLNTASNILDGKLVSTNETSPVLLTTLGVVGAQTNFGTLGVAGDAYFSGTINADGISALGDIEVGPSGIFSGIGSGITALNASNLVNGIVAVNLLTNITSVQIAAATLTLFTNLNGGTAGAVVAGVTNSWRADIAATNTTTLTTLNSASNVLRVAITATTNHFADIYPTNWLTGSAGMVISKTSDSSSALVAQSGGSGTGIQTNAGTGVNNVLTNLTVVGDENHTGGSITNVGSVLATNLVTALNITGITNRDLAISGLGGSNNTGALNLSSGGGYFHSNGADVNISAGYSLAVGAGSSSGNGVGGDITLLAGGSSASGQAGNIYLQPGTSGDIHHLGTVFIGRDHFGFVGTNVIFGPTFSSNSVSVTGSATATAGFAAGTNQLFETTTNVIGVRFAGSPEANGTYQYAGGKYTNRLTGSTRTNNGSAWVIFNVSGNALYSGTTLFGSNATASAGLSPVPSVFPGAKQYQQGQFVEGLLDSTNLTFQITNYVKPIFPTNNATASTDSVLIKTGGNAKWSPATPVLLSDTFFNGLYDTNFIRTYNIGTFSADWWWSNSVGAYYNANIGAVGETLLVYRSDYWAMTNTVLGETFALSTNFPFEWVTADNLFVSAGTEFDGFAYLRGRATTSEESSWTLSPTVATRTTFGTAAPKIAFSMSPSGITHGTDPTGANFTNVVTFLKAHGWNHIVQYISLDDGWSTTCTNIPAAVAHAETNGFKIIIWQDFSTADIPGVATGEGNLDDFNKAFTNFANWGVAEVKLDNSVVAGFSQPLRVIMDGFKTKIEQLACERGREIAVSTKYGQSFDPLLASYSHWDGAGGQDTDFTWVGFTHIFRQRRAGLPWAGNGKFPFAIEFNMGGRGDMGNTNYIRGALSMMSIGPMRFFIALTNYDALGQQCWTNDYWFRVYNDPLGLPGRMVSSNSARGEIWARTLFDGSKAVAFYNPTNQTTNTLVVTWPQLGWPVDLPVKVTSVWWRTNDQKTSSFTVPVSTNTAEMFIFTPTNRNW